MPLQTSTASCFLLGAGSSSAGRAGLVLWPSTVAANCRRPPLPHCAQSYGQVMGFAMFYGGLGGCRSPGSGSWMNSPRPCSSRRRWRCPSGRRAGSSNLTSVLCWPPSLCFSPVLRWTAGIRPQEHVWSGCFLHLRWSDGRGGVLCLPECSWQPSGPHTPCLPPHVGAFWMSLSLWVNIFQVLHAVFVFLALAAFYWSCPPASLRVSGTTGGCAAALLIGH